VGICRLFGPGPLEAQSTRLSADLPALLYITLPCQTVSAYRRRPVDQLVADALPRRERVMLNSLGMKRPGGGSSRLARFAPLRELTPAEESALNDLPKETRLRRRRAHDVASVLGSLHMDGLDVDAEAFAIAQRYVDGKISLAKMRAAISVHQFVSRSDHFK